MSGGPLGIFGHTSLAPGSVRDSAKVESDRTPDMLKFSNNKKSRDTEEEAAAMQSTEDF
jgi:hypothetical protein